MSTKLIRIPSNIPASVIQEAIDQSRGKHVFAGSVEDCQKVSEGLRLIGLKTWVRGRGTRKPGTVNAKGVEVDSKPGFYRSSAETLQSDLPLSMAETAVVYVEGSRVDAESKARVSKLIDALSSTVSHK